MDDTKKLLEQVKQMLAQNTMTQRERDHWDKIRKDLEAEVYRFSK
jgi:hypothetical protein